MNSIHSSFRIALALLAFPACGLGRLNAQATTPPSPSPAPTPTTKLAPFPGATAAKDETIQLGPFEVREASDKSSYRATESISGSGVVLPIRDIPVPIEVVTAALIEDRLALDLLQSSFMVAGLVTGGPVLTGQEAWRIHGYAAPGLRNGFRLDNDTTDTAEIDRVEVAMGPAAVLYGSGATGGAVNRITKKPRFVQEGKISAGIGDYDYYQGMIDVTGPVPLKFLERNGKPTLAYRAIFATNSAESDIDWFEKTRYSYNGSLRWQPLDRLYFTAEYSSNRREGRPSVEVTEGVDPGGAIAFNKDPTGRGYQFSIAGPDSNDKMQGDVFEVSGNFHIIDSVILNATYVYHESELHNLRPRRLDLWAQNRPAQLEEANEWVWQDLWKANLLWDWKARGFNNKLIVGAEGSTDHNKSKVYRISTWVPPADYTITPAVFNSLHSSNPVTNRDRTTYFRAYRIADSIGLFENRLNFLASIRKDEPTTQKDEVPHTYDTLEGDTTGQIGGVWDFTKDLGLFVNYSTDFVPNTQLSPSGAVLAPQHGKGIDVGIKFSMLRDQLTGSLSYFNEERTNIPSRIGQTNTFELSGKDRSRGIDFNSLYTLSTEWAFRFSASFFEAETLVNTADPSQVGLRPQDVCPESLSFQITYNGIGSLKNFSGGLGGYWHDDYPTESATNKRHERTDDVVIVDLFARYAFRISKQHASFTLNIANLFDKRAYIVNQEAFGPPQTIRGTLRYEF